MEVTLNHYLVLSATLFAIGVAGVFLRRNVITLLLSIEIMLNAVNLAGHRVLRDDRRRGGSGRGPGAHHRALPPPGVAQPRGVHESQVVTGGH